MLFFTQCVYMCIHFIIEPILRHFLLVVAISFIPIFSFVLFAVRWMLEYTTKSKKSSSKSNNNINSSSNKHYRVCLQQFSKNARFLCVCVFYIVVERHSISGFGSFCSSVDMHVYCCCRVCVCVCVRAWMSDDGKTNRKLFLLQLLISAPLQ